MPRGRNAMLGAVAALVTCGPDPTPRAVPLHPPAAALIDAMGLGDRIAAPDEESHGGRRSGGRTALVVLPPTGPRPTGIPADAVVLRFAPRDFAELFALSRRIGAALDAEPLAEAWIDATRLDLARLSAASLGDPRPHVAAIVSLDPLRIAGGASLETELLEIAGAESVSHGGSEWRVAIDQLPPDHRKPDLWLLMGAGTHSPAAIGRARAWLPTGAAVEDFMLAPTWLAEPVSAASRLRERIARIPTLPRL